MASNERKRGPWGHRLLVIGFGCLLTILLLWLLGFILSDIGDIPGPDYGEIAEKYVDSKIESGQADLMDEKKSIEGRIEDQREIQAILRNSTENSQQTMNQLLAMQKMSLEKGVRPTETEQASLAESEARFLENQKKFQEANETIAAMSEKKRGIEENLERLRKQLETQHEPAREEYNRLRRRHELKLAGLKLAVLLPLLAAASGFSLKRRGSAYAPLFHCCFVATFLQTGAVMHEHFPSEFFKYIAIGAAIAIVLAFLITLIRTVASPSKDWLLKQYREAYTKRLCPKCSYPIQRGPYKHIAWTRKGPLGFLPAGGESGCDSEEPYSCPACGERLYEKCEVCGEIRLSLLPHCQGCGDSKTIVG